MATFSGGRPGALVQQWVVRHSLRLLEDGDFTYVRSNPSNVLDPSGLQGMFASGLGCPPRLQIQLSDEIDCLGCANSATSDGFQARSRLLQGYEDHRLEDE